MFYLGDESCRLGTTQKKHFCFWSINIFLFCCGLAWGCVAAGRSSFSRQLAMFRTRRERKESAAFFFIALLSNFFSFIQFSKKKCFEILLIFPKPKKMYAAGLSSSLHSKVTISSFNNIAQKHCNCYYEDYIIVSERTFNLLPYAYQCALAKLSKLITKASSLEAQRELFESFSKKFTLHVEILRFWKGWVFLQKIFCWKKNFWKFKIRFGFVKSHFENICFWV